MFSFLISFLLLGVALPDADGWVPVEQKAPYLEEYPEEDAKMWVIFSKQLDQEAFHIRFPNDPICSELTGESVFFAMQGESRFLLHVEKRGKIEDAMQDRASYDWDKWVWESVIFTSHYQYTLRTENSNPSPDLHRQFLSSFVVFPAKN